MAILGPLLAASYCFILLLPCSNAEDNSNVGSESPCSCNLRGRVYNLGPLASSDGSPRFETDILGRNYAYNPCIPFTVNVPDCQDVAICSWDNKEKTYTDLGRQSNVQCQLNQGEEEMAFQIPNNPTQKTWIRMKCNPKKKGLQDASFSVIVDNLNSPVLEVEHNCCCPDGCPLGKPLPTITDQSWKTGFIIVVSIGGICIIVLLVLLAFYVRRRIRARGGNNEHVNLLQPRQGQNAVQHEGV